MVGAVKAQARALMKNAGFPRNFWFLALCMVCHIMMFVPQMRLVEKLHPMSACMATLRRWPIFVSLGA
jgi:hypothetical protein